MSEEERMEFLRQSIESHDRQIGELVQAVDKLVQVSNRDAETIRALARIAGVHDAG